MEGHAEKLVSGETNPKSFHYSSKESFHEKNYLPELKKGLAIAEQIEQLYGSPTDIEWAIKDGVFYVVQARPITSKIKEKEVYSSNTNLNENYPDPISPLLYSIARDSYYHFQKSVQVVSSPSEEIRKLKLVAMGRIFGCKNNYNMIRFKLFSASLSPIIESSHSTTFSYNRGKQEIKKDRRPAKLSFARVLILSLRWTETK